MKKQKVKGITKYPFTSGVYGWDVLMEGGFNRYVNLDTTENNNLTDELKVYQYLLNQGEVE